VRAGSRNIERGEDQVPVGQDVQMIKKKQPPLVVSLIPMTEMTSFQGSYIENIGFISVNNARGGSVFICLALDSIQAGSRVTLLAQAAGSLFYFKQYGWIPENFPVWAEMYHLELGMSTSDAFYERKKQILEKFKIPMTIPMLFRIKPELFNTDIEIKPNRISFDGLFSFIRILQGNEGIFFYTFADAAEKNFIDLLFRLFLISQSCWTELMLKGWIF